MWNPQKVLKNGEIQFGVGLTVRVGRLCPGPVLRSVDRVHGRLRGEEGSERRGAVEARASRTESGTRPVGEQRSCQQKQKQKQKEKQRQKQKITDENKINDKMK